MDIGESWVIGNAKPLAIIHNLSATNPVPVGLLSAFDEYMAAEMKADGFELMRCPGILTPPDCRP